ncbi:hypothetical protein GPN87_003313 [Salmonella enterica]|nr:hypothetical protein [Salmonella enterica]EBY8534580.1 hypothetical protein [Salmonella enterica subsp. enterica serovar Telelkebir]EDF9813739.1 hypothetical protein [Salmonella enterica subsp. enterica serovar Tennessee]EED8424345.1 hypothetical protein [Salmonella enterica subsp. enterica serovar Losangeles]EAP6781835.1 hypothetical protein [Salmonella enterica]
MKNLAFALSININPVVVLPTHQIIEIGIKDESLGYIYVENNNTQADCVVPFTNAGELSETDCIPCAMKALLAIRTNLIVDQIDVAEGAPESGIRGALLSALAKAAAKRTLN